MAKKGKYVYYFGGGKADGEGHMKELLGGKGAGLAEMTQIGVPVPPGFTITTEVCTIFNESGKKVPKAVDDQMEAALAKVERDLGMKFGDPGNPLLLSVRSGAKFSMPGMMDTILNLGLNQATVEGLAAKTGNPRFAWDSYRRFIQMFGKVVLDIDMELFESAIEKLKHKKGVTLDTELDADDWRSITGDFHKTVVKQTGEKFPDDPWTQLCMARDAVFDSWTNPRAVTYRRLNDLPDDLGTAVNVQAMVFGNMGTDSGTGVGFTRNPSTGDKEFYGEYLIDAQGEDVVAGVRTPKPITELGNEMPAVYKELRRITAMLEKYYKDIQDFEFTVQAGKLYMLQTRTGKRTGPAAVKIAVDMVRERLITKEEAVRRVAPMALDQLLHPVFDPKLRSRCSAVTQALNASPGAAAGQVVFTADDAVKWTQKGRKVVLVRKETSPDDVEGMHVSEGILTATGGMTSHAAVVGRQMGTPCVVGASEVRIDEVRKEFTIGDKKIKEGDSIAIDGATGEVFLGEIPTVESEIVQVVNGKLPAAKSKVYKQFAQLLKWADEIRSIEVWTNADGPKDAATAIGFGAQGIGLCRTEHMFFAEDRLPHVQQMIMADTVEQRQKHLDKLLPFQREDFTGIFEAMKGYPVTIRLLDPPLHEFLPKREELMVELARLEAVNKTETPKMTRTRKLLVQVNDLHEFNPMLGLRGCRLGITMPEITAMQARAIFEAAVAVKKKGKKVKPEVMVPLTGSVAEMKAARKIIDETAELVFKEMKTRVDYMVGTMIEVPRAALTADLIAHEADFFSFGTNDLTQTTYAFSRDDAGKFIKYYLDNKILEKDPFQTLDVEGVGQLVVMGVEKGRSVNPKLQIGICGEHGGDPRSVAFCNEVGMNYVSCSPFRVPIARLAAAQAALEQGTAKTSKAKASRKKAARKKK